MSQPPVSQPADWYPDPSGRHEHRYWDGAAWTDHVSDAGVASTDAYATAADATNGDATTADTGPGLDVRAAGLHQQVHIIAGVMVIRSAGSAMILSTNPRLRAPAAKYAARSR